MNKRSNNLNIPKKVITFGVILLVIIGTIMATDIATVTGNNGWEVTLDIVEIGGTDDYVVFGEKSDALDNKDSYDVPKPPPPVEEPYIRAWFDDKLADPYNILLKDYRKYPDNYKEWNLSVQWVPSDYTSSTNVTISWDISEVILSEYNSVILYDCDKNISREMTNSNAYEYSSEAMTPYHFQIIASGGTENNPPNNQNGQSPQDQNIPPIADASAGEPYTAYVEGEIIFDGSLSYDPDGYIVSWYWNFDDKTNGTGETITHNYSNPGTYNVTLTITDNNGDTDAYEIVAIIMEANRPPDSPIIDGVILGNKTTNYNYTAVTTDPDNDTIRYFFDWGDDTNTTSVFLENRLIYNTSHNWTTSGVYTVAVYAEDENNGVSGITEMKVFIDMNVQFIDDVIQGYLLDMDNDGIYDVFYNATGYETGVELQDNGNYLIDSDGDALWDYEYDPWTSVLIQYSGEGEYSEEEIDGTLWYLIGIVVILLVVIFIMVYGVKKLKGKQKLKKEVRQEMKEKAEHDIGEKKQM